MSGRIFCLILNMHRFPLRSIHKDAPFYLCGLIVALLNATRYCSEVDNASKLDVVWKKPAWIKRQQGWTEVRQETGQCAQMQPGKKTLAPFA